MQKYDLNLEDVNRIFNQESGLLGVSGISADLRTILAAMENGNTQANLAFDVYIHRLKNAIGAMVASLNGLDVLVFTAGVGENSAIVREKTCEGLTYLGLQLDQSELPDIKSKIMMLASCFWQMPRISKPILGLLLPPEV